MQENDELSDRLGRIDVLLLDRESYMKTLIEAKNNEINELRRLQSELARNFEETLEATKSLKGELSIYRRLLDGDGGLIQTIENAELNVKFKH